MSRAFLITLAFAILLVSLAAAPVVASDSGGAWSPAASMSTPRSFMTATLLPDGRVLVAGGFSVSPDCFLKPPGPGCVPPIFASAEIFNPRTGTWSATGSMAHARASHSATLLGNGKVLVAGGESLAGPMASAELFDPLTGTWSATGSMSVGRADLEGLNGVLLQDGRVLVTGGETATGPTATAEIYDPMTGVWTRTGNMNLPRGEESVTLLEDGRVLVAGGEIAGSPEAGGFTSTATAEIFNPRTGRWTFTGSMSQARIDHAAVLLSDEEDSGLVLVAGGHSESPPSTVSFNYLTSAELYDPETGTWTRTGSMPHPHGESESATVVLEDGRVLLTGGFTAIDTPQANTELYDPGSGTWSSAATMSSVRSGHTATLLGNGEVLAVGGLVRPPTATSSAELFSPEEE